MLNRDVLLDLAREIYGHLERKDFENIDKTKLSNILDCTFTGSKNNFKELFKKIPEMGKQE